MSVAGLKQSESVNQPYFPPCQLLLKGLGIEPLDLNEPQVSVSSAYLKLLIAKLLEATYIDERWYEEENQDVHGAVIASAIPSVKHHFTHTGYYEGRLPAELPFDASWYYEHYKDLQQVFAASDVSGLRTHFLTSGYFEGRVGTPEMAEEAQGWLAPPL
jgi:hypothetical protein